MKVSSRWLPPLLGFLTAIGPVSTDIYLPAFPAIEASFGSGEGSAQITLASWFAGLAVGQVTQGTLADRFGRRAPLLVGLGLYTVASVGCALAPSLGALTVMRIIAAFGGSASMVIPRAVVRDLADGHAAAKMMSQLMLIMGVAPILAPTLGGAVLSIASWRVIFWFATGYGLVAMALVWRALPETLAPPRRVRLSLAGTVSRYAAVLRERNFFVHATVNGCAMFGLFAYIGGSPPVYIEWFGLGPAAFGTAFGLAAGCYILGTQINPRILHRFGAPAVLRAGVRCYLAASLVLAGFAFGGHFGIASVFVPVAAAMFCMGFVMPNAAVGALSRHAAHAGSASALLGTMQFLLAAVSGTAVGWLTDGSPRPMAALMVAGAGCAVLVELFRLKPKGDPVP
jgi:DHA1 family bicyclomycin/chloramphenicol resistance-like MFS transporter